MAPFILMFSKYEIYFFIFGITILFCIKYRIDNIINLYMYVNKL